jgi:fused-like protein
MKYTTNEIPTTNNSEVNLFIKEIELLRTLPTNSHLVEYIGCYYMPNSIKLVLSLCSGSLYDCINTFKAKSMEFKMAWIIHVADHISKALYILHSRKIMHRDVKSMNVLYDGSLNCNGFSNGFSNGSSNGFSNMHFVLTDFGEAVKMKTPQTHTIKGTISWSAPEIFQQCYSYGADVWAFGMLLYEMMTLQIPYHKEKFVASAIIDAKTPEIGQNIMAKYADIIPLYEDCITYDENKRADMETVRRMIETLKTL